jgi:high-affinity iron transporter
MGEYPAAQGHLATTISMLIAFLIMLREGIEAALIVGIVAGYLHQTGRRHLLPAVWAGAGLAALLCLAFGIALDQTSGELPQKQQELFEGVVAFIAVAVLTSMVFWMRKAARGLHARLRDAVDDALRPGQNGGFALVGMVFLAVGREGLESVFFLLATFQQGAGWSVPAGAILGLAGAVIVGWAIYRGGARLNLGQFFRWTSLFIVVVAAGLLAGGVRALHEAGLWNGLQEVVFDLSHVLPTYSPLGAVLAGLFGYNDAPTVGEVVVYFAYLIPALFLLLRGSPAPASPRAA